MAVENVMEESDCEIRDCIFDSFLNAFLSNDLLIIIIYYNLFQNYHHYHLLICGQRVFAVGSCIIPYEQKNRTLDGLISNVDWIPTFSSLANLDPCDFTHIKFCDGMYYFFLFSVSFLSNLFFSCFFFVRSSN